MPQRPESFISSNPRWVVPAARACTRDGIGGVSVTTQPQPPNSSTP